MMSFLKDIVVMSFVMVVMMTSVAFPLYLYQHYNLNGFLAFLFAIFLMDAGVTVSNNLMNKHMDKASK